MVSGTRVRSFKSSQARHLSWAYARDVCFRKPAGNSNLRVRKSYRQGKRIAQSKSVPGLRPLSEIIKQTPSAKRSRALPDPRGTVGDGSRLTASTCSGCDCGERNPRFLARRSYGHTSTPVASTAENQLTSEIVSPSKAPSARFQ
jgi:hypothetical protein